jgi:hypothetical protein
MDDVFGRELKSGSYNCIARIAMADLIACRLKLSLTCSVEYHAAYSAAMLKGCIGCIYNGINFKFNNAYLLYIDAAHDLSSFSVFHYYSRSAII